MISKSSTAAAAYLSCCAAAPAAGAVLLYQEFNRLTFRLDFTAFIMYDDSNNKKIGHHKEPISFAVYSGRPPAKSRQRANEHQAIPTRCPAIKRAGSRGAARSVCPTPPTRLRPSGHVCIISPPGNACCVSCACPRLCAERRIEVPLRRSHSEGGSRSWAPHTCAGER